MCHCIEVFGDAVSSYSQQIEKQCLANSRLKSTACKLQIEEHCLTEDGQAVAQEVTG